MVASERMSSTKTDPHDANDRGPLIGGMMRLIYQSLVVDLERALDDAGITDIQPAHVPATRTLWDHPEGVRATELASAARVTKQSMAVLVDQLEERGYVERLDDPTDRRAKLVALTRRGREVTRLMRAATRRTEADWGRRIGEERLAALRSTLRDLLDSLDAAGRAR
jgi:DNA-binding MarR family transcriptional regulator